MRDRPSSTPELFARRGFFGLALHLLHPAFRKFFNAAHPILVVILALVCARYFGPLPLVFFGLYGWWFWHQRGLLRDVETAYGKNSTEARDLRARQESNKPVLYERNWDWITDPPPGGVIDPDPKRSAPRFGRKRPDKDA